MNSTQRIIGSCVRAFREQQGFSLETLANKAGISYQYLSGVETGKENFTIQVLESLAHALVIPVRTLVATAYDNAEGTRAPRLARQFFRPQTPLPTGLNIDQIEAAANQTQAIVHRINHNLRLEVGTSLQKLIQGNNFSGLVSNLFSNAMDLHSCYKHNHDQKYPDLIFTHPQTAVKTGLEIKITKNIGKGGESHNGHSGWHLIACYDFLDSGDIDFVHIMLANLNSHQHDNPDWNYVGSAVNLETGSRRTETYTTNLRGTTKLRDGSVFLNPQKVAYSRWRQERDDQVPNWSIFSG